MDKIKSDSNSLTVDVKLTKSVHNFPISGSGRKGSKKEVPTKDLVKMVEKLVDKMKEGNKKFIK